MNSRWYLLLGGIVDILFGAILLLYPVNTVNLIFLLFGIYATLQGIALVVASVADSDSPYRGWLLGGGILSFLAGIIALFYREAAIYILIYFIAFRALFVGIAELVTSISMRKVIQNEFLLGFVGVLNILFGLYLLFYPIASAALLILLLGWYSIIVGIILVVRSFLRPTGMAIA